MKRIACFLLVALVSLQARADGWLENGDFTDGNSHWYGDAKWPTDFAPPDPFTKADPFTSQGMIVKPRGSDWIKICQDFKGKSANGVLTISYALSPDFAFSTKSDDYQNVPDKIGYDAWLPFAAPLQSWVIFITDITALKGRYFPIQPEMGSTKEQTASLPVNDVTPYSDKTITLAFPPGSGMLVIHKIQINDP